MDSGGAETVLLRFESTGLVTAIRQGESLNLHPETRAIVAKLQELSGKRVEVIEDPRLPVKASITLNPGSRDRFVLAYRPGGLGRDYFVAFECGFALRQFSIEAGERVVFASTPAATAWIESAISHGTTRLAALPAELRNGMVKNLSAGLLTQLRSIPVGMRVAEWIRGEYPGLWEIQGQAIAQEQQESTGSLGSEVRASIPDEILAASISMNAAHALFADRLLETSVYQVPYRASGFFELGEGLLRVWDEVPTTPDQDRVLIDRWAQTLGLEDHYRWIPAEPDTGPAAATN